MGLAEALLDLQDLTRRLRRDCPWDREQTERTIVPHTVEEAYEVAEAQQGILAGQDTAAHLAEEAADVIYHLFVVLASAGVTPAQVYGVLEQRHGPGGRGGKP